MKTRAEIEYKVMPYGLIATIPEGTPVYPANNLPEKGKFQVCKWANMTDEAESWLMNYGFLLSIDEVI